MRSFEAVGCLAIAIIVATSGCAFRGDAPRASEAAEVLPLKSGVVFASAANAALDSHLLNGGGTDDTATLQRVLDQAAEGHPIHLVIDGAALVSGLNVYGNTTIECLQGAGLYLKDGAARALIRNAHRSRDAILDQHITIRGCFLNGNRHRQPFRVRSLAGVDVPVHQESDRSWMSGLQFHGVSDLLLEDVTLWNIRTFGATIGNAHRVAIRNLTVDHGSPSDDVDLDYANVDGVHFFGPARYITIDGMKLRTADDGLAFDAATDDTTLARNDSGPYVGQGPITDVTVSNVIFMNSVQGFRFLSSKDRIDRVVISNVTGTIKGAWFATISHYMTPDTLGNMGSITFDNVSVSRSGPDAKMAYDWMRVVRNSKADTAMYEEFNEGVSPFFNINGHVEHLVISNFSTQVADERPIVRFGPDAKVEMMTADLSLYDPQRKGVPFELDAGSHIQKFSVSLSWQGVEGLQGRNPIVNHGGTIGQLNWMTPMATQKSSSAKP